ncbi:MAG: SCO family protein, partial [Bacteroidota bacterium]
LQEVNQLLKSLKVFTPLIEDHAPIMMIGKDGEDNWIRTNGLAQPNKLADILYSRLGVAKKVKQEDKKPGHSYFTDTKLTNQYGEEMAFYTDLLMDKVVLINPFFAECTGSCPVMHATIQKIQDYLGDKLGTEVNMISITVDPKNDTPEKLAAYADRFGAKKGWYFLSGDQASIELIQGKLGKSVDSREEHDTIFLIGNVNTRLWKKVDGLSNPEKIIPLLEEVLNDKGA